MTRSAVNRVYLDACSVCRVFDDRSQSRIRAEAEAIEALFREFVTKHIVWVSSEALVNELQRDINGNRRNASLSLLFLAGETWQVDFATESRAKELRAAGYGAYDALHLACAEHSSVNALLTTDDRFIKRAIRGFGKPRVAVQNPLNWWGIVP
jgi:predicted nucleic acid-binding protein